MTSAKLQPTPLPPCKELEDIINIGILFIGKDWKELQKELKFPQWAPVEASLVLTELDGPRMAVNVVYGVSENRVFIEVTDQRVVSVYRVV